MFSFADTPVTFVGLLLLFAWCTAWCAYELTRPQDVRQRISNSLHLAMSIVMLLMVASPTWTLLVAVLPTFALAGGFALATAWFAALAVASRRASAERGWLHFVGHAAMFAAMTWHLSAMGVMSAAMSPGMGPGMGAGGMDADAGGMGSGGTAGLTSPGGTMWAFALAGLPLMTYLLASSLRSLVQATKPADSAAADTCPCGPGCDCGPGCSCYVTHARAAERDPELVAAGAVPASRPVEVRPVSTRTCHELRPVGTTKFRLEALAGFAMNLGMFWMSTGLIVPVLPFFAALAF